MNHDIACVTLWLLPSSIACGGVLCPLRSVPLTLWFFGAVWMFVGTCIVLCFMYTLDYVHETSLPVPNLPSTAPDGASGNRTVTIHLPADGKTTATGGTVSSGGVSESKASGAGTGLVQAFNASERGVCGDDLRV